MTSSTPGRTVLYLTTEVILKEAGQLHSSTALTLLCHLCAMPCREHVLSSLAPQCNLVILQETTMQDNGKSELHAENAAYAREVAELFASSRRGIDRSATGSFSSPAAVRTPSAGSGLPAARVGPLSSGTLSQPIQARGILMRSCNPCTCGRVIRMVSCPLCPGLKAESWSMGTCITASLHPCSCQTLPCVTSRPAQWTLKMLLGAQEGARGSGSIQKQQDRSSSSPASLRREDVLAGDQAAAIRPRAITAEVTSILQPPPVQYDTWPAVSLPQ